jgi:hypothetical protein
MAASTPPITPPTTPPMRVLRFRSDTAPDAGRDVAVEVAADMVFKSITETTVTCCPLLMLV